MSSRESREQGESGRKGSEAEGTEGTGGQPRQGAGRVEARTQDEPRHHFESGRAPSEQGAKNSPGPEQIRQNQQGFLGTGTGKQGNHVRGDRSQESADSES
jgi:hypothetical protein